MEKIKCMNHFSTSHFLHILLEMGEALETSGAEVYRVEDTLNRIGYAYHAEEMNVFVITSSMVITLKMPGEDAVTQTRRIRRSAGNDFVKLEDLNELSRIVCNDPIPLSEFEDRLHDITKIELNPYKWLIGDILVASNFAIFFGGTVPDAIIAGLVGIFIWFLQRYLSKLCMNNVVFQFLASFTSGFVICLLFDMLPSLKESVLPGIHQSFLAGLHMDKILIGDIMLLIPGLMFTNAIRDILLGDTISGIMRLIEAILLAGALALGFLSAIWIVQNVIL